MKPKPHDSSPARAHHKVPSPPLNEERLRGGQAQERSEHVSADGNEAEPEQGADTKRDGNHSEPLKDEMTRKAASAEQTKLQANPDSLPVVGYPTKRSATSAISNPADPHLPTPAKLKR